MSNGYLPNEYRVVTFQSKEVVDILHSGNNYFADKNKMREGSLCLEDIEVCRGCIPVWVFQHPAFKTTNIGPRQWSEMLQTFRCEMSIDTLDGMYMIELLLPYQPPMGKAHNGTSLACIIPSINLEQVQGIYKLKETEHWYFYSIAPVSIYSSNVLFPKEHTFTKEEYNADDTPRIHLSDFASAEDYYKSNTPIERNKDIDVPLVKRDHSQVKSEIKSLGMSKVGYDELLKLQSVVRRSSDDKAIKLLEYLDGLTKQARFQHYVNFMYDVINAINSVYPNYVNTCSEDSLPFTLHFMLNGKPEKCTFTKDEFAYYFKLIKSKGVCTCTANGLRPEVYELKVDSVGFRTEDCSEGYTKYISFYVDDALYLEIVLDYHEGLLIKKTKDDNTINVFRALMKTYVETTK